MKHSIILKSIAIVLAAVALVAAVGGAMGLIGLADAGLYNKSVTELRQERLNEMVYSVAVSLVREYIGENLSGMTENALKNSSFFNEYEYNYYIFSENLGSNGWSYAIRENDKVVKLDEAPQVGLKEYQNTVSLVYPKLLWYEEVSEKGDPTVSTTVSGMDENTEPSVPATTSMPTIPEDVDECMRWYNHETGTYFDYYIQYTTSPEYQVSIYLPKDYHPYGSNSYWNMLMVLSSLCNLFLPGLLVGLLVFAGAMVYLILAAGHRRGTDIIRAGGLNRLPLDLYTAAAVGGVVLLCVIGVEVAGWLLSDLLLLQSGFAVLAVLPFFGASLLAVGYLFCLAAQLKTPGGFWWRNSLLGWCLRLLRRGCRWLWRSGLRLLGLMNAMWQWILVGVALCFGWFLVVAWGAFLPALFMVVVTGAVVCYGAYAFGILLEGARRMADGDLNRQIDSKHLIGCFADCASRLNALADVAVVAAQKQLKSDRMKTELITNVSHDIKTPLTSIINYVDLLQKPHTPEEQTEYLAVLSRQSGQMKKLIEDLMDMSKATTGNMPVEIMEMDAVEAVNQALGEFADKLEAASLYPVIRCQEEKVMIRADGRLTWRVLSNLLQNAVKYALPGTRLYVDINRVEGNGVISLKNISREELNISADELMERFVRGDASRNTEGSGLGLNIAKSLMELQKGQLQLLVDGDLFKTSLIFPAAE